MTPLEFLTAVWPDAGFYCIATPFPNKGMNHKVFSTVAEAASYVDQVSVSNNVYFATHTLKAERIWNDKTQDWSVRTQENTRSSRVLFFDLDVDPKKPATKYATQGEAAAGILRFVTETKLPHPMVVSSGGGLHVYWRLDRELASAGEWLTQAARLKQLANHHGLKIDPARTTDSASVLRVAGSFNLKHGTRRAVVVKKAGDVTAVEDWDSRLVAALAAAQIVPEAEKNMILAALGSNTKREFEQQPPPTMLSLLKACPQMRRLAQLRGNNSEPEWYWGDIGVVKFTENGRANVHKISSGHPKYTHAETEAKMDQWDAGPTTCKKLESVCGTNLCKACPHFGTSSSPIWFAGLEDKAPPPQVAQETVDDQVVMLKIPDPPMPYRRAKSGGIEVLVESKAGKQFPVLIYPYDLYPVDRSTNSHTETEQQLWHAHLPHGVVQKFTIEASTFVSDRDLQSRLANNGIYAPKFPELKAYMSAYIQELQRTQPVSIQHNHLGWIDDHTRFVMPTKILKPDGGADRVALGGSAGNARTFVGTKGTLAEQVRLMKFLKDPAYIPNQFFVLASLGASIFFGTGHHGVIVHAAGEAGTSKTTALYTAASMWGPPKKFSLNGTTDGATALARSARREVLSNLPLCLDEITHIAADVAKNFAMNATQPGGRIRLKFDGTARSESDNERSSMTLTTANTSLHSLLQIDNTAGTAGSVRVFEIVFAKRGVHTPQEADEFLRGINENYGHLGEKFIAAAVRVRDLIVKRIIATMSRLGVTASMQEEERFWFAAAASSIVAGELAVKLGLLDWDIQAIESWLIRVQLPYMRSVLREQVLSVSPSSILMDYLESINGDMIKMVRPHGGNISNMIQEPRGPVLAHYDVDDKIMYVLRDGFRRYCERRGQYAVAMLKYLHASCIVTNTQCTKTLGAGTKHAKGSSNCFIIDMAHQEIVGSQLPTVNRPAPILTVLPGGKVTI